MQLVVHNCLASYPSMIETEVLLNTDLKYIHICINYPDLARFSFNPSFLAFKNVYSFTRQIWQKGHTGQIGQAEKIGLI